MVSEVLSGVKDKDGWYARLSFKNGRRSVIKLGGFHGYFLTEQKAEWPDALILGKGNFSTSDDAGRKDDPIADTIREFLRSYYDVVISDAAVDDFSVAIPMHAIDFVYCWKPSSK